MLFEFILEFVQGFQPTLAYNVEIAKDVIDINYIMCTKSYALKWGYKWMTFIAWYMKLPFNVLT